MAETGETERPRALRLFVAVALPPEARAPIERLVGQVRSAGDGRSKVRWVRMEGLHLTLRFLGPTAPERLTVVEQVVRQSAKVGRPFRVGLAGAGAFPSGKRPRVLWLDVVEGHPELESLTADLDRGLHAAGWPLETRPFRPHLTLARTDGARDAATAAAAIVELGAALDVCWTADSVTLFESRTGGGPPRYEPLFVAPLGAS